jgi:putative nucleotidyltransferase with HDIG domain
MTIKRIPLSKLEVGMYVSDQTIGLENGPFKQKGFVRKEETLAKMLKLGIPEVYIDTERGKDSVFSLPLTSARTDLESAVSVEEERPRAEALYNEALSVVDNLMQDVKLGAVVNVDAVEELAGGIVDSLSNNHNALLCLSQIREKDEYLLTHSVNVGMMLGIFARSLGYDGETLHQLVTGGILHDIGKIRVPDEVLNKPGKLDDEEWKEMQRHVIYGQQALRRSGVDNPIVLSVSAQHHERLDGTGYPARLSEERINSFGRMAAIVDVYDAITADRVYHEGMQPNEALKRMMQWTGDHLDKSLLYDFIRCMSVYPVGSLLKLDNDKLAFVTAANIKNPHQPKIKTAYDLKAGKAMISSEIDMAAMTTPINILGVVEPADYSLKIADYL